MPSSLKKTLIEIVPVTATEVVLRHRAGHSSGNVSLTVDGGRPKTIKPERRMVAGDALTAQIIMHLRERPWTLRRHSCQYSGTKVECLVHR